MKILLTAVIMALHKDSEFIRVDDAFEDMFDANGSEIVISDAINTVLNKSTLQNDQNEVSDAKCRKTTTHHLPQTT